MTETSFFDEVVACARTHKSFAAELFVHRVLMTLHVSRPEFSRKHLPEFIKQVEKDRLTAANPARHDEMIAALRKL